MQIIRELQPSLIWKYFDEILKIPRPSKKEEQIIAYLESFAKKNCLSYKKDNAGNIVILKKASKGFENLVPIVLQSHMDMVCEKNADSPHNFNTDPVQVYIEDGWIKSKGTTLGADNGIGVAAQLAVLADAHIVHGPLECLFTVDEETGMTGALRLEENFINGKILLNLDSEDEGELFIGCAGGMDTVINIPFKLAPVNDIIIAYKISVSGLTGGHSGDDINKGFANAIKILSRFLLNVSNKFETRLHDFQGGNLRNAIPREAYATITLNSDTEQSFKEFTNEFVQSLKTELSISDPNFQLITEPVEAPKFVLDSEDQKQLLNSLHACPNGVIKMSDTIPGLVETSTNLASVKIIDNKYFNIITSQRSSINSAKRNISDIIKAQFNFAHAEITQTDNYPGWTPDQDSEILKLTKECYLELFNKEPLVRSIHAGLECGLFLLKFPGLDMISFGPTIKGAHSPNERLEINTVDKFWKLLLHVIRKIPGSE